jgi:hypothetical protein
MKENVEIGRTVASLRSQLKFSSDKTKLDLYWSLLEECMDQHCDNATYVGELWLLYLNGKIELIDKRKREMNESYK